MKVVVVGAGLSGLMCARAAVGNGHEVTVLDKGRGVGGRLATRRSEGATFDHGAQFFTVRSPEFASHVSRWLEAGVVREWCTGFGDQDGHPRYVGVTGMTSIAKHLAHDLDVRTSTLVFSLKSRTDGWDVITDDGGVHAAERVVLTAPLPQSFSLMFSAGLEMPADLRSIDYDRTVGLLVTLDDAKHSIPPPGGMQNPDGVFSFIGDNAAKGISERPALTFHANPAWSLEHFEKGQDELESLLRSAAEPWLGSARIVTAQVKKWRFATPRSVWPESCWVDETGTLGLAGDAFAGPKVEGAALSGLSVATRLGLVGDAGEQS